MDMTDTNENSMDVFENLEHHPLPHSLSDTLCFEYENILLEDEKCISDTMEDTYTGYMYRTTYIKSLTSSLSEWCCKHNITHVPINDLLNILKPYHPELPLDARTLLHTPRKTILQPINFGQYVHFGLRNCLQKLLSQYSGKECLDTVEILINIDGLPLSKSSSSQVYPILCSLYPKQGPVDIVGIYHVYEKPKDCNLFLEKFVKDAIEIIHNGMKYESRTYFIKIKGFICDAPAKAYITCTKVHSGYMSCSKCDIEGVYTNRICFPDTKNFHLHTA